LSATWYHAAHETPDSESCAGCSGCWPCVHAERQRRASEDGDAHGQVITFLTFFTFFTFFTGGDDAHYEEKEEVSQEINDARVRLQAKFDRWSKIHGARAFDEAKVRTLAVVTR
jgi:hypothetical protein